MSELRRLFNELDDAAGDRREAITRAPFGYPGGKSKSLQYILPELPYRDVYVSVFGGSGVDLLARQTSPLEVFNDRYAGVVAFYRCLRDADKLKALVELVELTVHAREEMLECKATWEQQNSDVERAFRWYYMVVYSFGALGRNFGRSTGPKANVAGKLRNKIPLLHKVHSRLKRVQIENLDWQRCMEDYDSPKTVFYLDPPYVDAYPGTYKFELSHQRHRDLLDMIASVEGFCALSSYENPLYEGLSIWSRVIKWDAYVSITPAAFTKENYKSKETSKRGHARECLYIKEANAT